MPKLAARTFWSFGHYDGYSKCPRKYKFRHIDRKPISPHPAMSRGSDIHSLFEDFLNGRIPFPPELNTHQMEIEELATMGALSEERWAFDNDWQDTPWRQGWCRMIIDAHCWEWDTTVMKMVDLKTGRVYPNHKDQGHLYALGMFIMYPLCTEVIVEFYYVDQDHTYKKRYYAKNMKAMMKHWNVLSKRIMTDPICAPTPNPQVCNWCDYAKSKGGPCEFG